MLKSEEKNIIDQFPLKSIDEAFAYFAKEVKSCHIKVGTKSEDCPYPLHSAKYTINEDSLLVGVKILANSVIKLLGD